MKIRNKCILFVMFLFLSVVSYGSSAERRVYGAEGMSIKALNMASNEVLGVWEGSLNDGAEVVTWFSNQPSDDHVWVLEESGQGSYIFTNNKSGKVLSVNENGGLVQTDKRMDGGMEYKRQRWIIRKAGNKGYFALQNLFSSQYLGAKREHRLEMSDYITGNAQIWKITEASLNGSDITVTGRCYQITADAGKGGRIEPSGIINVDEGGRKVFTITPDAGYLIKDVTINGQSAGLVQSINLDYVCEDKAIKVEFMRNAERDKLAAQKVDDIISGIAKTNSRDKAAINLARKAYDRLDEEQKRLVKNYSILLQAEQSQASNTSQGNFLKVGTKYNYKEFQFEVTRSDEKKKTVALLKPLKGKLTSVVVPNVIKIKDQSYQVTEIRKKAFYGQKSLKTVTIGKHVATIGKQAFQGCKKLKKIKIKSESLKSVGDRAFKGIEEDAVVNVPKNRLKAYQKLLKGKGFSKKAKIK